MPPVEFERTVSAGERPQTYALDRAAAGIFLIILSPLNIIIFKAFNYLFIFLYA
jgi:hypothetical protein